MKVVLSACAGADLDGIFEFTVNTWGHGQAARYVGSFDEIFASLGRDPQLGRQPGITSRYRRVRHGSHFIFYRVMTEAIRIERILHIRMDAPRHLP